MPPRRTIPGTSQEWLARAKSNLLMAKGVKVEGIFWEDLCFNAQQAAEKSIKAVLQHKQIPFRYVHDLEEVTEEEYYRAITLAEQVVHWAESLLTPATP